MDGVENAVQDIRSVGLPDVEQNHRPQFGSPAVGTVALICDDLIGEHVDGLPSGVGLSRAEEAKDLSTPVEYPAVRLELGVLGERADPGGGPAAVDVSVVADNQGPTVAHSTPSLGWSDHDAPHLLNLSRA
ncbi:hypothetical protein OHB00_06930 [Streptomyces sp. NBC_00631]